MLPPSGRLHGLLCFLLLGTVAPAAAGQSARVDFARDVRPVLAEHCFRCHGPKKQEGGLRLDVRRRAMQGGDSGPAIVARKGGELLLRVTSADDEKRMPPSGKPLSDTQVAALRAWVTLGAPWPDELAGKEAYEDHWAFRPVARPPVPAVKDRSRVRSPVDAFVLARLEAKGLALSPEADRRTLIRRLHLDLLGLPPAPRDVEAFVADTAPDAYERLVARLLASPHFGERWGRHWLDLARFAESDGYENDAVRPNAFRFRDWVIDAFNRDLPFDQFTEEQLAGDLLPGATSWQKAGTGFHRNTLHNSAASGDREEFRTRAVKDRTDTTGTAWMGLTLGCAQCHSHKYDPLTQREYYRLYAFFNGTDNADVPVPGGQAPVLREVKRTTHVHRRGNFLDRGEEVGPGTPAFLPPLMGRGKAPPDRLDLARWLVDPRHPLTARVEVNRVWQHLFGQGLVPTPENFGTNGEPPTHPELLDWLASEFVRAGWSRKALLRTVLLSSVYRQSSATRPDLAKLDPGNRLLARQGRFRVEAEVVRDLALAASGLLDRKIGGPSIVPPFPEGMPTGQFSAEGMKLPGGDRHRRGLYIHTQRTLTFPMLATFDGADGNQPCVRRDRSTTPMQALTLLNDPVFIECARALGARLRREAKDQDERLRLGFRLCLGRPPSAEELAVLNDLVRQQQKLRASEEAVWGGVARTLLNLDEFITRE
jgi:mono/diheme cytochrome c family protein